MESDYSILQQIYSENYVQYQISSESPKLYGRYYKKKHFGLFSPDTVYVHFIRQIIIIISGCNRATGHHEYGPKYRHQIVECVRRSAEHCDCLQCFFVLHSMGGGT